MRDRTADRTHTSTLRIALVDCTGILGAIIERTVADDPAAEVVARLDGTALDGESLRRIGPDVVVWREADDTVVARLLDGAHAVPPVIASVDDGRSAVCWRLVPTRERIEDEPDDGSGPVSLSRASLVRALHDACAAARHPSKEHHA